MENGPLQIDASTNLLTIFCVFHLTGFSHPSILQLQIRGTWKRHTDRVETEDGPARTESSPLLSENFEREVLALRPSAWRSICCKADVERAAAAVLWRFALAGLQLLGSRLFLAWQLHESICVRFSPSPGSEAWPPTRE